MPPWKLGCLVTTTFGCLKGENEWWRFFLWGGSLRVFVTVRILLRQEVRFWMGLACLFLKLKGVFRGGQTRCKYDRNWYLDTFPFSMYFVALFSDSDVLRLNPCGYIIFPNHRFQIRLLWRRFFSSTKLHFKKNDCIRNWNVLLFSSPLLPPKRPHKSLFDKFYHSLFSLKDLEDELEVALFCSSFFAVFWCFVKPLGTHFTITRKNPSMKTGKHWEANACRTRQENLNCFGVLALRGQHARSIQTKIDVGTLFFSDGK